MTRLALILGLTAVCARAQDYPAPSGEVDLQQSYQWAREEAESLKVQKEQIYQVEQQYKQALAAALPNVSFNAAEKWIDTSGAGANSGSFLFNSPQPQVNFTLSQPIFSGFREYAAMNGFKHQGQATGLQLRHAQTVLYQNVANSFYLVINLEGQLANAQNGVKLSGDRIKELQRFEDLGKSRHSEVTLVESQEASQEAQVAALKGQVAVARQLLSFLTGKDLSSVKLVDKIDRVRALEAETSALARAYERTDVKALLKLVEYEDDQIKLAKGALYPTISFLGNYYLSRQSALQPIHWDAQVGGSLPLFAGGGQTAAIRQAESSAKQARYNLDFGTRSAKNDIHSAYLTLSAAVDGAAAAERAYQKADDTYQRETKEYRLGIVTNLDVMTALNALIAAKTSFDQIIVQAKLDLLQLRLADEELP